MKEYYIDGMGRADHCGIGYYVSDETDKEILKIKADRYEWKAKAERYGYALECIMGSHPAEDEMFNIARAALQEDTP